MKYFLKHKKFLNKPVPECPIPHDNKTGTDWMNEYAWQSDFVVKVQKNAVRLILTTLL